MNLFICGALNCTEESSMNDHMWESGMFSVTEGIVWFRPLMISVSLNAFDNFCFFECSAFSFLILLLTKWMSLFPLPVFFEFVLLLWTQPGGSYFLYYICPSIYIFLWSFLLKKWFLVVVPALKVKTGRYLNSSEKKKRFGALLWSLGRNCARVTTRDNFKRKCRSQSVETEKNKIEKHIESYRYTFLIGLVYEPR